MIGSERSLILRVVKTIPGLSIKRNEIGAALYASKGQQVEIHCEIIAENLAKCILSIAYNSAFLKLLNESDIVELGTGSFTRQFVWKLLPLLESSGAMGLQLEVTDQEIRRVARLNIVVEHNSL